MLSHVLCILPQETTLQIETGRQRDPKESWREDTHRSFYTHRGFYTEKPLHRGVFYTQKVLHREAFTQRSFCTQTSWSFYTQKLLPKEVFTALTHRCVCTQKLLHREAFTQRAFIHGSFYTQRNLYTDALSHREAFTQKSLYTEKLLHTETFTHKSFYTEKSLHRGAFTRSNKLKSAAVPWGKLFAGAFGNSLAPKQKRLFPTNMFQKT